MNFANEQKTPIMPVMPLTPLSQLMQENGKLDKYDAGQVFHAHDFNETLFMLKKGYVKRYQITNTKERVIELIYGPKHIFPLSQIYRRIFDLNMNQEEMVYVYVTMSDVEILSLKGNVVIDAVNKDKDLYQGLFYEAGLRLRSNIHRLASNSFRDDYKKVAHQLVGLADEFGILVTRKGEQVTRIDVPQEPVDIAEQLNISVDAAKKSLKRLRDAGLIKTEGKHILVPNTNFLRDVYAPPLR